MRINTIFLINNRIDIIINIFDIQLNIRLFLFQYFPFSFLLVSLATLPFTYPLWMWIKWNINLYLYFKIIIIVIEILTTNLKLITYHILNNICEVNTNCFVIRNKWKFSTKYMSRKLIIIFSSFTLNLIPTYLGNLVIFQRQ